MPFQVVPQAALIQVQGVMDNQLTIIDLSFVNSAAVTPVNLANLCGSVVTWATGSLAPQLSRDWASVRVVGVDLSDPIGARVEFAAAQAGGVDVESAPNNVAACISFRTAQRGRSGHGRNYLPGIPNSLVDLNTLDPAFMSNIVTIYEPLIGAGVFNAGWEWCVVSRQTAGALRPTGITIPIISVSFVSDKVRSMRSREVGHGA